ncbi:MAG: hypothetical protein GX029_03085 [Pseudomonadaceae bacterium]|nr:hypothetical protein [Pseudomonadaceae bacterium]
MLSSRSNFNVEVVRPDDGRLESFWVTLFILAVLLLGGLGVWARQAPVTLTEPSASLNTAQRQLLLELSIAADEIAFMEDILGAEELKLANLTEQALLPVFVGQDFEAWQAISQGCFLLAQPKSNAAFVLRLEANTPPAIFFIPELIENPHTCNELSSWLRMDNNQ